MIVKSLFLAAVFAVAACKSTTGSQVASDYGAPRNPANVVKFTVLQLNDVYEIAPVESGRRGGLARVATLRKQLLAENPHTYTILAGDFISPSAMGVTKLEGKAIAGAQMVDALNAMGLDIATIGNHEFDMGEAPLLERIAQSKFKWVISNVFNGQGQMYPGTIESHSYKVPGPNGQSIDVAFFGVCLEMVKKPFIQYKKPVEVASAMAEKLSDAEVIIALTHLSAAEDKLVAASVPKLDILLGGHEHENAAFVAGDDNTPVFKADGNARTAYVHRFTYDLDAKKVRIDSKLVEIDQGIPEDPATAAVVNGWTNKVFDTLRASGIDPDEIVGEAVEPLDAFEGSVRNRPTNFTKLIGEAFLKAEPEADAAVYGSGSIRIDDRIAPGKITQWDIVRIFPFGGKNILVNIRGDVLKKALDQGMANKGSGGYLQLARIDGDATAGWNVKGQPLDPAKTYKILFNDFLLTGQEKGLGFLNPELEASGIEKIRDSKEVRLSLIDKLNSDLAAQ